MPSWKAPGQAQPAVLIESTVVTVNIHLQRNTGNPTASRFYLVRTKLLRCYQSPTQSA
jgi:hypothetical protein